MIGLTPGAAPRRTPKTLFRLMFFACGLSIADAGMVLADDQQPPSMLGGQPMGSARSGRRLGPQDNEPHIAPSLPVPKVKEPWPRLDKGAVLCRSRDDLVRLQTRAQGDTGPAPDCHVVRDRIAIKILERDGPSRTHVVASEDAKQTGWTNVYLSLDPPASATTPTNVRPTILPGEPGSGGGGRPRRGGPGGGAPMGGPGG